MATVKILYDSEASHLENYLKRNQEEREMPTTEHGCALNGVAKEFASLQLDHASKGNNSIHLIQSWSPQESKGLTKDQVHGMGIELASRFAPGHQFIVQTHDDQPHLHNHIMINPVSIETGKRIQNKLSNIRTVRNINDDIAREHGLSVLPPQEKLTRPGPNEKAKRIEAYRGRSYLLDLSRKADFARSLATNYDEYLSVLGAFDIKARVEPQNITYFYPGREHGKRGKNLDPALDKAGLERKFAENLERSDRDPEFRKRANETLNRPRADLASKTARPLTPLSTQRRDQLHTEPRSKVLDESLIPVAALQSAKGKSILEYCERQKIPLQQGTDGRRFIQGREALEVSPYSWTNHKNGTRGNAIDFVANHQRVSFLNAVSILTDNPRLLLLEQYAGREASQYRPFYLTDQSSASRGEAIASLTRLLGRPCQRDEFSALFKRQRVHVNTQGVIRFFSERQGSEFAEYIPDANGGFQRARTGAKAPFYSRIKGASELELYSDPRSLLFHRSEPSAGDQKTKCGVLALLEPSVEGVHRAIADQKHLLRIHLIGTPGSESEPAFRRFHDDLKDSLNPFSIDIRLAWKPISLGQSVKGAIRESDLTQSHEQPFFQGR